MKTTITIFVAIIIQVSAFSQTTIPITELNARAGLPNFFYKLHHGDSVKIVYFGGSITEADSGWRDQTMDWLKAKYPKCPIQHKNAALQGTGSDFGAFRTDKDVVSYKPDLVFIEFAVNDGSDCSKSMEGIVRKIRKQLPYCEICFVYTVCFFYDSILRVGKLPGSASTMEKVADHYQISSIFMASEVVKFLKDDKLVWKGKIEENPGKFVFAPDGVHPYSQTGHKLYAEAVGRSFQKMETTSKHEKHQIPNPLNKDNFELATMIPVSEFIKSTTDWEFLQKGNVVFDRFTHFLPVLAKSKNENASITVKFKGSKLGVMDVSGPSACFINVSVNNATPKLYKRFDQWSTYYRINYFLIDEINKEGEYSVTIKVSDEKFDKKAVLLENQDNKGIELNEEYKKYDYYTSYVMLIGSLIK